MSPFGQESHARLFCPDCSVYDYEFVEWPPSCMPDSDKRVISSARKKVPNDARGVGWKQSSRMTFPSIFKSCVSPTCLSTKCMLRCNFTLEISKELQSDNTGRTVRQIGRPPGRQGSYNGAALAGWKCRASDFTFGKWRQYIPQFRLR